MLKDEILKMFPNKVRSMFMQAALQSENIQEIRIRAGAPVIIKSMSREIFLTTEGKFTEDIHLAAVLHENELEQILEHICDYSIYAYENEIKQGFITVPGGHRIGVAGQVVLEADGSVRMMKNIRYLNIRISHEIKGAANALYPYLYEGESLCNTLLISPPGCGKTTMLRDLIRLISIGNEERPGMTVGVVDERSELSGSYMGIAQNDLGIRTDVLEGCPKDVGMMLLIRSMAPQVIAVDEIGSEEDVRALISAMKCGCRILATIHAESIEEVKKKHNLRQLLEDKSFQRYILLAKLNGQCIVDKIYVDGALNMETKIIRK